MCMCARARSLSHTPTLPSLAYQGRYRATTAFMEKKRKVVVSRVHVRARAHLRCGARDCHCRRKQSEDARRIFTLDTLDKDTLFVRHTFKDAHTDSYAIREAPRNTHTLSLSLSHAHTHTHTHTHTLTHSGEGDRGIKSNTQIYTF